MLRASIDLGTNTCLLLIAEWDPVSKCVTRVHSDHATVVRLGQGVDQTRLIQPEASLRTLICLKKYSGLVRDSGLDPSQVICVATSQARDAKNGVEFFSQVERKSGFKFRVLTGDQEAQFTFLGGLLPRSDPKQSAVIDIGGGSTELMALQGGQSVDLGSVRFTERYLKSDPVTDQEFWNCQESIDQGLEPLKSWRAALPSQMDLVGVAGTATTLAAWHLELKKYDAAQIDQVILTRGDVHRQVEELKWRSVQERRALSGVEEGRADVLLAGALILWRAMELLQFPELKVSSRGLRFGVLSLV